MHTKKLILHKMNRANEKNINTPVYWETYTGNSYRSLARKTGIPKYLEVVKHIDKDSEMLDVGCNFGDFLKYMLENKIDFKSYVGLDFSKVAIEEAKKELLSYEWFLDDCQEHVYTKNKYNRVIAIQMLEHIEEPEVFLKKVFCSLQENGKIIITVPNGVRIQHKSHVWYFEKEDLYKMLHLAGFGNINFKVINDKNNLLVVATKLRKITIVTPVLCPSENVFNTIKKCFSSIRKAVNRVNGEWIVVDDGSAVGKEFFSEIADIYIRNEKTEGVSSSLNKGMEIGTGSFMVKLDSDYFVPENLFEILLNDWSDDLAFIAPSFTLGKPHDKNHFKEENIPIPEGGLFNKPSGMNSFSKYQWGGGILMFDTKKIKEIDYFDENFNTGSAQDNDVIYRILMKGYNWRWSNNVLTRHFASISSNDPNAPDSRGERRRIGKEIFERKHGFKTGGFISQIFQHFKYSDKHIKV